MAWLKLSIFAELMPTEAEKYDRRGVSASKSEVHQAIHKLDKGLYPTAFCKILPDIAAGDPEYCNIMHADTAGTKTSLAYLYWKETGDKSVWRGIAQDALVMNLDDMACVGSLDGIMISSTIARNKHLIPGEVIEEIIEGTIDLMEMLARHDVQLYHAGGETADTGDIVRTIDVGYTAFARLARKDLVINRIKPGAVIVGLASDGQATYESAYNSGIGSNGLTSARHDLLNKYYATHFPESVSPETDPAYTYTGPWRLTDEVEVPGGKTDIGHLILSPTRTFLPVLAPLIRNHRDEIQGIIHCTGGGFSKVLKFLSEPVQLNIDATYELPTIFKLIREASGTPLQEMYKVFNMGMRMILFVPPEMVPQVQRVAQSFEIHSVVLGEVSAAQTSSVRIQTGDANEPEVVFSV